MNTYDRMLKSVDRRWPTLRDCQDAGYVYLMRCGHLYKIGRSLNPQDRLRVFKATNNKYLLREGLNSSDTELIGVIKVDNMFKAERDMHRRFAASRYTGYSGKTSPELFVLSDQDVTVFLSLSDCNAQNGTLVL